MASRGSRKFVQEISSFTCNVPVDAQTSPTRAEICANPYRASLKFTEIEVSRLQRVLAVDQIGLEDADDSFYVRGVRAWCSRIETVTSNHSPTHIIYTTYL